jgi:hypothetical protein
MTTITAQLTSTRSYLDGAARVVETAHPEKGSSTVELWLYDAAADRWEVRTVDSTDGLVGPPVVRSWEEKGQPVDVPSDHLPKITSDFDFLTGHWLIRNRRLRERLAGCTDWDEFEHPFEARTHLNGLVSVDEGPVPLPSPHRGMTFRTYDVAADEWRLHWFDSRTLQMDASPVRGRFVDAPQGRVGDFVAPDTHAGVPILCRFRWTVLGPRSATWEQAFSTDGGATWETNMANTQERLD